MSPARLVTSCLAVTLAFTLLPLLLLQPVYAAQAADTPAAQKASTPASQSSPVSTISVDSRLVNIPVVIRDKKGALVQNLTRADFTLQVDGHPQVIRYFDIDKDLPLTLGLLVDTSQSQRSVIDEERTASGVFLDQMLTTDKDKAFVLQFSGSVELLQDLTNSRPKLQAALKELDTTSPSSSNSSDDSNSNSGGRSHSGGGTTLYDATFLASDEVMSKQKGRKALIILSDGVDRNSKENITRAIEAAQRADTIIYAIYFKGEDHNDDHQQHSGSPGGRGGGFPGGGGRYPGGGYPGGGGGYPGGGGRGGPSGPSQSRVDGKKILERMAGETGGRLFEVSKKQDTAQIYTQIAEELRAQYRLGYTPDAATASDGYHQIDLALSKADQKKNYFIQTRDGYYTGK